MTHVCQRSFGKSQGFTLVELMIVLVIVSVLLGIAVPSFRSYIADQRYRGASSDLRIALMTARSEAVKRNRQIQLTPVSGSWSSGWEIDSLNPGDPKLLEHSLSSDSQITVTMAVGDSVIFRPSGRASELVRFDIVSGSGDAARSGCLRISASGFVTDEGCP